MKKITKLFSIVMAFFAIIGTSAYAQTPSVPSADSGHYYILYSAQNGTKPLLKPDNSQFKPAGFLNTAGKVLCADPNLNDGDKLYYANLADIEAGPGRDYALWQIEKTCTGIVLKNKGNGKYVRESKRVSDLPYEMEIKQEGSSDQYAFRTKKNATDFGGFCIPWTGNKADSWNPQQGENGYTAWIWEEQLETTTQPTLNCTELTVAGSTGGSAYIKTTGRPTTANIDGTGTEIYAAADAGYKFVKWNDGTTDFTDNPYNYVGTDNKTFTATFEKLGTGTILASDELDGKYFYIQSAANGLAADWNAGDTRNNVLYADGTNGKLKHGSVYTDYALWFVEDGKLKNKGSGLFMTGSREQDAAGQPFTAEAVGSNGQSQIKTGNNSYTCAWKSNNADRLSSQGENGATSWYFVFDSKVTTDITSLKEQNISITVRNGILNVAGADKFTVYTIAGQKVNANQKLHKGVYIVKVKDTAVKVLVK